MLAPSFTLLFYYFYPAEYKEAVLIAQDSLSELLFHAKRSLFRFLRDYPERVDASALELHLKMKMRLVRKLLHGGVSNRAELRAGLHGVALLNNYKVLQNMH